MTKPLDDILVLDLSLNAPGPMATMMLGDFGADVIHIVRPGFGSFAETYGGAAADNPMVKLRLSPHDAVMRNKRSLALDLKSAAGKEIFLKLAAKADVLVEEMRPGKMAKLGLGYEDLKSVNPRLVYCSITGYGQTGPMRDEPGHDINYLAMSGILDMSRAADGTPVSAQTILADHGGGSMAAVTGILMALLSRQKTGRGQHVDASATDGVIYLMADLYSAALGGKARSETWRGSFMGELPHYGVYRCADDKWLSVGALEEHFFYELCAVLERPDLMTMLDDPAQWEQLKQKLAEIFETESRDSWMEIFAGRNVCVAPVLSPEEVAGHSNTVDRGMIRHVHGLQQVGISPKLSDTPGGIETAPVTPGADSERILAELGLDAAAIAALRRSGVTQ